MSDISAEGLPAELVRLTWTLHRALLQRQTPPSGETARPLAQVEVLRLVASQPGISVRGVAEALRMQPNNVSTLVTRLQRDGLLDRRRSEHDRRAAELHPSERSLAAGAEVNDSLHRAIGDALDRLDPAAVARITEALPDLMDLVRALSSPA
ncbi:MarR family transcriptional regulator [Streptomyces sp. LP11]|uniref:MarR family transcriptional regulator n=1 Tax=Streptomyces pyxinicus TaxID=2970331 RepID=A0ABT2AYV0_9ACTN|nr:MarR family transcriptional regulator [Streptomyces sp. LP11]MCS0601434.1 MarR family transcriptional regulator [Streptomyces sp. LP11]